MITSGFVNKYTVFFIKNRCSWKKCHRVITKLILIYFLMILTISCNTKNINNPVFIKEIEDSLNLKFPASTDWVGVHADYEAKDIEYLYCCISVPSNELFTIFPENKFSWQTDIAFVFNSQGGNEKWFKPDSIRVFKSFQEKHPDSKHVLNVLAERDISNSDEIILVFIVWWYHR